MDESSNLPEYMDVDPPSLINELAILLQDLAIDDGIADLTVTFERLTLDGSEQMETLWYSEEPL